MRFWVRRWLIGALVLWCCMAPATAQALDDTTLLAGVGQADITPPIGTPLAGYSKRHGDPSTGIEAPLAARALALRQGSTTVIIASVEILIINEALFDAVTERVTERFGSPPDALLLTATHTHSGSGAYGEHFLEKLSMGAYQPAVFEQLADGVTLAIGRALNDLAPAETGYSETTVPALIQNRRETGGLVDARVQVLGVRGTADQRWRALLVNFAAHPTTLGSDNRRLSGDYPGVWMRTLEAQRPGSICLFTIGNLGDQSPVIAQKHDETMIAYGQQLATATTAALARLTWSSAPRLGLAATHVPLPGGRLRLGWLKLPRFLVQMLLQDRAGRVTVVRVGEALLVGYPGEPTAAVGRRLKDHLVAQGWHPILIALSHEYLGYVVTEEEYAQDSYEAQMSFFGPNLATRLEEAVVGLAERLHATTR